MTLTRKRRAAPSFLAPSGAAGARRRLGALISAAGFLGTVLLGAALAIAPIAAFEDRMTLVSGLGIAGIALLLVAWAFRKMGRAPAQSDDSRHSGSDPN